MPIERVDQRVLGALRLVDRVTHAPLLRPLNCSSTRASSVRNRRGYYVVTNAVGLETHSASFLQPPTLPPLESEIYSFEIEDPLKRYLPRLMTLRLPRDPSPANAANANSLFKPVDVAMYPASTTTLSLNWSTLRISVTAAPDQTVVRGALLQVIDAANEKLLASGISDEQGEALVIVAGVPITKFADDEGAGGAASPVVVSTLPVRLELSLGVTTPWPVNPDVLEQNHVANRRLSMDLTLSTGRMERVVINLT